ncbi:FxLYD domain-containing protein [Cytobacillus massiliigabonensis]|uniref:FxLYD domain-containing protein n=1 Tax=Cytobacillus massiliigabonensis TaxID=1871011 RepID=UPI000C8453B5|nr:FxLYD domain-containing protein [Cytobacillus massiliigabonensis]
MKKFYAIFTIMLLLFVAACSNGEHAGSSESSGGATKSEDSGKKEESKEEPKLEVVDSTASSWKNSIDTVWVHSAAVYKNTGNTPVDIGETQITYKGQDDSVLGTSTMIYSVPEVVQPGETAFIVDSTTLDGQADPAIFKESSYNYGFDETDKSSNLLETSGVKGIAGDSFSPYKVTGLVKNITDAKQDDIRIAAGLFDANGKLLGVLKGSVDVGLNAGGESGFELSYPDIPASIVPNIASVEVKAFAWNW